MPELVFVETSLNEKIENLLKDMENYVLTLFMAAWYMIKFMRTDSFEIISKKQKNL